MVEPDMIIDDMQADADGVIAVDTGDLPDGTNERDHVVVGDHDAEPAVARILQIGPERTVLRVIPGAAADHAALLAR